MKAALVGTVVAAALAGTAGASPIRWIDVQLGGHRFGQLSAPQALVAHAPADAVGFSKDEPGTCGCGDGPRGPSLFDVGRDGTVWLLDGLKHRFLVWRPGQPSRPARVVPLAANVAIMDFTLAPDGGVYAYAHDLGDGHAGLLAFAPSGRLRWRAAVALGLARQLSNPLLRIASDGALWVFTPPQAWRRLTTATGRPVPAQRTSATEPVTAGLRLLTTQPTEHVVHYALVDSRGRVVRAWRVRSATSLGVVHATPELGGDDLLVPLDVTRQQGARFLWEHLVLRLTPQGTTRIVALPARAVVGGDDSARALRIAGDGHVYQLRSDPKNGVTVLRYASP